MGGSAQRQLALNAVTALATVVILAGISAAAYVVAAGDRTRDRSPVQMTALMPRPPQLVARRLFGIAADPWHIDRLTQVVGHRFDIVMSFSAWPAHRNPAAFLAEAARKGLVPMVTWEPWQALAASGAHRRLTRRTGVYHAIATGRYDGYIRMYARACARYGGVILLRYAPGMNDRWYPLPSPARAYVAAWRHVVRTFRAAGANKVMFVFSVNPSLYIRSARAWLGGVRAYWPGAGFVTWVGATMIDFGGARETSVQSLASRVALLRRFGKPVIVTEANADYRVRYRWMRSFRSWLASAPWVRAVVWSQAQAHARLPGMGNMDWKLVRDPRAARVIGSMIASRDVHDARGRVDRLTPVS